LHLAQGAGPAIEPKYFVREGYRLVALQISDLATSIARSRRYVFRSELLIQSALQRRNLGRCEAVHDAFFIRVRHVAAMVLIARPATTLVNGDLQSNAHRGLEEVTHAGMIAL
jgi:hypothetical protein